MLAQSPPTFFMNTNQLATTARLTSAPCSAGGGLLLTQAAKFTSIFSLSIFEEGDDGGKGIEEILIGLFVLYVVSSSASSFPVYFIEISTFLMYVWKKQSVCLQ